MIDDDLLGEYREAAKILREKWGNKIALRPGEVLVWVLPTPEKTKGGLLLPGQSQDDMEATSQYGIVLRASDVDAESVPFDRACDFVSFPRYEPYPFRIGKTQKILVRLMSDLKARPTEPDMVFTNADPFHEILAWVNENV